MEQNQIQELKQKLIDQKKLIEELDATLKEGSQTVVLDQSKVGRLSRMDAMQGQQISLEASRRRQQQLKNIESALKRIDEEEFGFCLLCGEEIDIRRLAFDPSNSHCINCVE